MSSDSREIEDTVNGSPARVPADGSVVQDVQDPSQTSKGLFKWFVVFTFLFLSMSNAMAWLIFAPIPIQTATYYGITGKYSDSMS